MDVSEANPLGMERIEQQLFSEMLRIRLVEEKIVAEYPSDKIKSPVHLSIGQEAIAVGVCAGLTDTDAVFGTYRSHAMYLAKGGDLRKMIAELYGKKSGCGRGKSGSMHLVDVSKGVYGTSAVVGTTIPNATGYAQAQKYNKTGSLVACFLGDGATEEGVFFESLNYAALKALPIIYVCENNNYAIHANQSSRQANLDLVRKVEGFGVPAARVESNHVTDIYKLVGSVAQKVRAGGGPYFVECATYRWLEHVGPREDGGLGYRSQSEIDEWIARDSIATLSASIPSDILNNIERSIRAEISSAFQFAEASPMPESEELLWHVFK